MSLERLLMPIYVPRWLDRAAVKFKRALIPPARVNGNHHVTQAFIEQFNQFKEQSSLDGRFEPEQSDWLPFLNDNTLQTEFDPHYVLYTYLLGGSHGVLLFAGDWLFLSEFTLIANEGQFCENADPCLLAGREYGCGCFRYTKRRQDEFTIQRSMGEAHR